MDPTSFQSYTSGRGKDSIVPPEILRWNWGAFFLNWVWGLGNSTYIALLALIAPLNLVMPFVLGAKGSEWAWRNRSWRDVEHFKTTQRKWAWAGGLVWVVLATSLIATVFTIMRQSEPFRMSFHEIQRHREAVSLLGEPIEPGLFVTGNVSTSPDGEADLHYSVTGSKAKGDVSVYALKQAGRWTLEEVIVELPATHQRVSVIPPE